MHRNVCNPSVPQQVHAITFFDQLEAVGDHYNRFLAPQPGERVDDGRFGLSVEIRGRLVDDENLRIAVEGPGDSEPLTLAAGQALAALTGAASSPPGSARTVASTCAARSAFHTCSSSISSSGSPNATLRRTVSSIR